MIIIKYNYMASYTKSLEKLFLHTSNLKIYRLKPYQERIKLIENLIQGKQVKESNNIYISTIGDITSLSEKELLNGIVLCNKPTILFTLTPFQDFIRSMSFRKVNGGESLTNFEDMIRAFYKMHCDAVGVQSYNLDLFNLERAIAHRGLEYLIDLHIQGKINLLILSKDTILNNPNKILTYLNLSILPEGELTFVKHPSNPIEPAPRFNKTVNEDRKQLFYKTVEQYDDYLTARYIEIDKLLKENNIPRI